MADIRAIYNETLSNMYPYEFEIDLEISGNDMLYNLICISQNNFAFPIEDEETEKDYNRIMSLIELFTILGFKPSIY